MERIKAQNEERENLATAALTWICHSERPLHVDELCHALAVEIGETDFDEENVPSINILLDWFSTTRFRHSGFGVQIRIDAS